MTAAFHDSSSPCVQSSHLYAFMSNEILELSGFPLADIIHIKYFATQIFEMRNSFLSVIMRWVSIGCDWTGISYNNPSLYIECVNMGSHYIPVSLILQTSPDICI